jgi:hypothetical protein
MQSKESKKFGEHERRIQNQTKKAGFQPALFARRPSPIPIISPGGTLCC